MSSPKNRTIEIETITSQDQSAEITKKDISEAKAAWKRHAPKQFQGLLDAKVVKPKK